MRIAVLDSDPVQTNVIQDVVKAGGHSCLPYHSGKAVLEAMRAEDCDLLILNWKVQDIPAPELIDAIRHATDGKLPVLALIAPTARQDAVSALTAADDYLVTPLRRTELTLRLQALLKTAYPEHEAETLQFGWYAFEPQTGRAWANGKPVTLTQKEFAVALLLFRNLNRPLSRAYLRESVWPHETELPSRTIDTHVSRVRTKLGLHPEHGFQLIPIYSFGYRLEQVAD